MLKMFTGMEVAKVINGLEGIATLKEIYIDEEIGGYMVLKIDTVYGDDFENIAKFKVIKWDEKSNDFNFTVIYEVGEYEEQKRINELWEMKQFLIDSIKFYFDNIA